MQGKRKLNQIENDDWNNSNDSESEIVTVKKGVTKRSKLKDIDECKIDSKMAQGSIRKKILPYHLFAMNFTVIHGISAPIFFCRKVRFLSHFQGISNPKKRILFLQKLKMLREFWPTERKFSFWGLEFPGNGIKTSLSYKKI